MPVIWLIVSVCGTSECQIPSGLIRPTVSIVQLFLFFLFICCTFSHLQEVIMYSASVMLCQKLLHLMLTIFVPSVEFNGGGFFPVFFPQREQQACKPNYASFFFRVAICFPVQPRQVCQVTCESPPPLHLWTILLQPL